MVNSIFPERQEQGWVWRLAISALLCATTTSVSAQEPYYNQQYKIYAQAPAARVARAATPVATPPAQPFPVEFSDPPAPRGMEAPEPKYSALSRTFSANSTRAAVPTGRVQDIFGENPQGDVFGEEPTQQQSGNPFQKVDPPQQPNAQVPQNPFGEITPQQDNGNQAPGGNPFSELPTDPTPITPPMDTRPRQDNGQQVDPQLPDEFTPNIGNINPNPPIPGETPVQRDDPGELPNVTQDPELTNDETSIFDGKEPEIEDEKPDNSDVPPVPTPNSSRVYLPAREPSDYAAPTGKHAMVAPPGYYDPRMYGNNPYANLPGPYGYAMPPQPYMPGMMPMPPTPYGQYGQVPYGQCGPGCTPTNQCGSCNSCNTCNTCDNAVATSCGSRGDCGVRPTLAGTDIVDIGERIVETGCVDPCAPETYVEVVSDCDNMCSNFASCYIGLFGGLADLNELITRSNVGRGVYTDDSGYLFGLTVGQIQGRNLRTELELSYRNTGINGLQLEGDMASQFVGVNGDYGVFAGMFNGYWEFVDAPMGSFKPYIGAGVGFAIGRPNLIQSDGVEAVINSDDSSFAWQAMAGFNYKASPTLDAFLEYRYFVADSFRLDTEIPEVAGLGNGSGPFDYQSSNVLFGLRARF